MTPFYLVDSDVLIRSKNDHYAFDFCPGFWDWLIQMNAAGRVFSVEAVLHELRKGKDDLAAWVRGSGAPMFLEPDADCVRSFGEISTWVRACGDYDEAACNEFLQKADYFLVGHALAHGGTVVTHEVRSNSRKRVKIPDACDAMGVRQVSVWDMLRETGACFVAGAATVSV